MAGDRADAQPPDCSSGTEADDAPARNSAGRGSRILLVDDDDLNRALVRTALSRSADPRLRSALLLEAADLAGAHAALAEGRVDMVLLDVRLPDGSGLELAAELNRAGGPSPPTVVALTGAMEPAMRSAALAAGCAAALGKPYRVSSLCELITAELYRQADTARPSRGAAS